jgi:multidrug efflux pump subunit AcrA (membrane-fusion protein)
VRQSGQPFVFAVADKDQKLTVSRRPVTLGPLGEQTYVVEAGLKAGDRIAVSSLQALRDGAPIRSKVGKGESADNDVSTSKARE